MTPPTDDPDVSEAARSLVKRSWENTTDRQARTAPARAARLAKARAAQHPEMYDEDGRVVLYRLDDGSIHHAWCSTISEPNPSRVIPTVHEMEWLAMTAGPWRPCCADQCRADIHTLLKARIVEGPPPDVSSCALLELQPTTLLPSEPRDNYRYGQSSTSAIQTVVIDLSTYDLLGRPSAVIVTVEPA